MRIYRPILVSIAAVVLALGWSPAAGGSAGSASAAVTSVDVPLQPGAPVIDNSGNLYRGTYCTLNFVFKDKAATNPKTYIGTSSNCFRGVGVRVSAPQIGSFGTIVFWDNRLHPQFALIRIDTAKLKYVSRVMRGYSAAPSGYTTSAQTNTGDPLVTHGWPAAGTGPSGVTRTGVLAGDTSTMWGSTIQPVILDRGSPVMRVLDGKALGISNELAWPFNHATIEGILTSLKKAGFNVTI